MTRPNELGVDIRTGTKGTDLVMTDGTCTGVTVTNNDNESYTINAKAVIVATGGFSANKELLAEYAPGYEVLNTSLAFSECFLEVIEEYEL